jgi:hypothetical protein
MFLLVGDWGVAAVLAWDGRYARSIRASPVVRLLVFTPSATFDASRLFRTSWFGAMSSDAR